MNSNFTLTFSECFKYPDNLQGINFDLVLSLGIENPVLASVKLDTGSTLCVFQRYYAEMLGLNVEKGEPEIIYTATGKFLALGQLITAYCRHRERRGNL